MGTETPKAMTPEEIANIQESRILSDAELVKGGAKIRPENSRLEVTGNQRELGREEMHNDFDARVYAYAREIDKKNAEIEKLKFEIRDLEIKKAKIENY